MSYWLLCFQTITAQVWLYRCHSMQLNNQYWGRALPSVVGERWKHWTRFVEYIRGAVSFSNRNSLSQSASSFTGWCHSTREAMQHCASDLFPGIYTQVIQPRKSILWTKDCVQLWFFCHGTVYVHGRVPKFNLSSVMLRYSTIYGIHWLLRLIQQLTHDTTAFYLAHVHTIDSRFFTPS